MIIKDLISGRVSIFINLLDKHNVFSLYAFGSSVRDGFNPSESDIDLLVELYDKDPIEKGEHLMSLWDGLEVFFDKKVDLLTDASIKNPFLRKSIDSSKVKIYDGRGKKVFV